MEAKMKKTVIRDTERNEELTLIALRVEYEVLKSAGETEAETFEDYLENITDGNGTCEWIWKQTGAKAPTNERKWKWTIF